MTLYKLLNDEAQNWWYYKTLRAEGNVKEARKRERQAIRSSARHLRAAIKNGGFCTIGRGGWVLTISESLEVSHCHGSIEATYPQACLLLKIPVIDSTTIPDSKIIKVTQFPTPAIIPDNPPWGSCSFAPIEVVAALYASLGATLYNITPAKVTSDGVPRYNIVFN